MNRPTRVSIQAVTLGAVTGAAALGALGLLGGGMVGLIRGYGGSGEQVLFTPGHTPTAPEFWCVLYDMEDAPTLVRSDASPFNPPPGMFTVPRETTRRTTGPWEAEPPAGEHDFAGGGVRFEHQPGGVTAFLTLHPAELTDGWSRFTYVYRAGERIELIDARRERGFNEWGGKVAIIHAATGGLGGLVAGLLIGGGVGMRVARYPARRSRF